MRLSVYEILKDALENPKLNWVKVDYEGHALDGISAEMRTMFGETVSPVKKSHFLAQRMTSSQSTSLLLTMKRDTGSRNEDDEFDYRSLAIASLDHETLKGILRIPNIMVAEDFKTYVPLSLENLPIFPAPHNDVVFANDLKALRVLEAVKGLASSHLSNLKKLLAKQGVTDQDDYRITWEPPTGTRNAVLDEKGNEVKEISSPSMGFQLHPTNLGSTFNKANYGFDNIVELFKEIEALKTMIEAKMSFLRPYELGVMERLTDVDSPFLIGDVQFSVKRTPGSRYAHSKETLDKIKNGGYTLGQVPKSRGAWKFEKIEVPSTEKVKKTKAQKV